VDERQHEGRPIDVAVTDFVVQGGLKKPRSSSSLTCQLFALNMREKKLPFLGTSITNKAAFII